MKELIFSIDNESLVNVVLFHKSYTCSCLSDVTNPVDIIESTNVILVMSEAYTSSTLKP